MVTTNAPRARAIAMRNRSVACPGVLRVLKRQVDAVRQERIGRDEQQEIPAAEDAPGERKRRQQDSNRGDSTADSDSGTLPVRIGSVSRYAVSAGMSRISRPKSTKKAITEGSAAFHGRPTPRPQR